MLKSLEVRVAALIVAVSAALLLTFTLYTVSFSADREIAIAKERQQSSVAAAAAALDAELEDVTVTFGPDGSPSRIVWSQEPDLSSHALIDRIGAMTGETATVFAFEQENGDFWRRSTNIKKDNGERAVGTPLGTGGAVHPVMMRGETFEGEATILGKDYYTIYVPIWDEAGSIAGILYVGVTKAVIQATIFNRSLELGLLSLALLILVAAGSYTAAKRSFRDLARVKAALEQVSRGETLSVIPGATRSDAIGDLARAVDVFRGDRAQMAEMDAERDAAQQRIVSERAEMIERLKESFGAAAQAAAAGDFSVRVETAFDEPALRKMATDYNAVLETVETGLRETSNALKGLADGDLTRRMSGRFDGAFAELQDSVNTTIERLSDLVSKISVTSGSVSRGAGDITGLAQDMSSRAEQQASSLQETAATMEEMSASIKSNAESSDSAKVLAADASDRAGAGGDIVQRAVAAMTEIEKSASKIEDIISVIDGIAFQTNLLALNAAVEAARAGDAGKGFAVVASEVRGLAQRSSEASRDIRQLIETSAQQVSEGVRLVTDTGASLEGIVDSIGKVEEAIKSIAAGSVEQATGVAEVSNTVSHMDEITQQNASVASRGANNARSLAEEARSLQDLISVFTLEGRAAGENWRSAS